MLARIAQLPLFLLLLGVSSASMVIPAVIARYTQEYHDARAFFYGALIGVLVTVMVGIALSGRKHQTNALRQLVALAAAFLFLPVFFAVPFHEAVRTTSFENAYFEMVSALTTTGATLFDPTRLSVPEHFWRVQVGWMGGLLMWVAASGILAPLALGGFEVTATGEPGQANLPGVTRVTGNDPGQRFWRSVRVLLPVYAGLTAALAVMLLVAGDPPLVAISHAMSTLATSGISPVGNVSNAPSGLAGEIILFCFLFFALSRLTFSTDTRNVHGLWYDPEFRLGVIIVAAVPILLFMRHWWAAFDVGDERDMMAGLRAFWGALFTGLSFLSTTGFVSGDWSTAQGWSGLSTPGIILMGLALVGGGVATTAGGVKLLRVFALYLNGKRELERLIHPHSVGRKGLTGGRIRREGAFIAWVSFMLFALTIAVLTMVLGLWGVDLEPAIVLTIATLSNTGPLVLQAAAEPVQVVAMGWDIKVILGLAMVLGRLELLAVIVMLTPDVWRN